MVAFFDAGRLGTWSFLLTGVIEQHRAPEGCGGLAPGPVTLTSVSQVLKEYFAREQTGNFQDRPGS